MIHVKYVYSGSGNIIYASVFICAIYMCIYFPYIHVNLRHMGTIWRGHIFSGTPMTIICEVDIVVACVLAHVCTNVGSIWPCFLRAV